jgi:hypothetical protein
VARPAGPLVGVAVVRAIAIIHVAIVIFDIAILAILWHPILILFLAGIAVLTVIAWSRVMDEGWMESLKSVGGFLVIAHILAALPPLVYGWLTARSISVFSTDTFWNFFLISMDLSNPPRRQLIWPMLWENESIWWRSLVCLLIICASAGFFAGVLRPRHADRHTVWSQTLKGMALGSFISALMSAALTIAVIVVIQLSFDGTVDLGSRWFAPAGAALLALVLTGGVTLVSYALCYVILASGRSIPWKLPSAIREGVKLGLLVRLAGSYAFLHRLQLEYLAELRSKAKQVVK